MVRRLIRVLPRWLYRFQPAFLCLGLFSFFMWGQLGFVGLVGLVLMVFYLVPGQILFWLLSWLAVRRSPDKRLGFSTLPFSVYLLAVPLIYFTLPDVVSDGPNGEPPSAAMRLASVMGLQLTRAVSGDLAGVFLMVVQVAGALALLAVLIDIARALDRASRAEQPAQQEGKNEQAGAETAPTSAGAAPPSAGVAPQDPSACG